MTGNCTRLFHSTLVSRDMAVPGCVVAIKMKELDA